MKQKKLNKKGFTLVELLAVIVVTTLVLGLSSYGIINALKSSKDTTIVLNEASILEAARISSAESGTEWRKLDNKEYFCTTIQRLKNIGLLKKNAESKEHDDVALITVKRNTTTLNVEDTSFASEEDTSIHDLCNIKYYTIHYDYNVPNESGAVPKNKKSEVSVVTHLSSFVPKRKGYLFNGWNSEPDGTGMGNYQANAEFTYDSPSEITLYAQWKLNTYKINYYLGNNSSTKGSKLVGSSTCVSSDSNCSLTLWQDLHAAPPYEDKGWTFAGWTTDKNSTSVNYTDGYTKNFSNDPGKTIELYALFKRNIIFYSGRNSATVKEKIQYYNPYYLNASYYTSVDIPKGASLSGWDYFGYTTVNNIAGSSEDLSAQGKSIYKSSIKRNPIYDPKLYAMYERDLTLKFNKNGGSGTTISDSVKKQYYNTGNVTTTVVFTLPNNTYTKSGYTFSGWNTAANGKGTTYAAGSEYSFGPSVTSTSTTKTLYARWISNGYSIVFDSNSNGEATGTMQTMDCQTGTTYTLNKNVYDWQGHSFGGWNTKRDGTGDPYKDEQSVRDLVSSGSITLYAQWKDDTYTITFKQNGASSIGALSKTCIKNVACSLPNITRAGYEIIGWGTSSDSTTAVSNPYIGDRDITLYAITKKSFTIIYKTKYNDTYDSGLSIEDATISNNNVNQTCTGTASERTCTCYMYNNQEGCKFLTPKIAGGTTGENNYYYSTNPTNYSYTSYSMENSGVAYAGAEGYTKYLSTNTVFYVTYKPVTVTFEPNGAKLDGGTNQITKVCKAPPGQETTCEITAPTITRNGYSVVGYGATSGSTTSVLSNGGKISLGENKTYYANTKKTITITFDANNSGLSIENLSSCSGDASLRACSCYMYNTETGCSYTTPKIAGDASWNNGYYYSINSSETRPYDSSNSGIAYAGATGNTENLGNNSTTYYVAYKKVEVTFKPNGAEFNNITKSCAASLGYSGQTSSWNNEHTKCSVTAPTITRSGYEIVGYNTSASATSSQLASGGAITLGANATYHAITRKKFTINYDANGSGFALEDADTDNQVCNGNNNLRNCSCYMYNTQQGCRFTTPKIAGKTTYENGYYYSADKYETNQYGESHSVNAYAGASGDTTNLNNNTTFYVAYKKVNVTFKPNGAKLDGGTSDIKKSCAASLGYRGQTSCSVTAPIITVNDNDYYVIGYNTSSTATSSQLASGGTDSYGEDKTYYAITKQYDSKYVTWSGGINCYKDTNKTSIIVDFKCGDWLGWLIKSEIGNWYYKDNYKCYVDGDYLSSTKPSCSSGGGGGGTSSPGSCRCNTVKDCIPNVGYSRDICDNTWCYYKKNVDGSSVFGCA